jgi:hypothetical protein
MSRRRFIRTLVMNNFICTLSPQRVLRSRLQGDGNYVASA